jgi:DNA-binding beta-propeller fold protein YncE
MRLSEMKRRWYITFHGGAEPRAWNNIHVYSAEGKELGKGLDQDSLPPGLDLRELRGHAFGPDGNLYVANAFHNYSQVLRFDGGLNHRKRHAFRDVFVRYDAILNPGLNHPFNIAFDSRGDLYVTSQNTNLVLRYRGPNSRDGVPAAPMPLPFGLLGKGNFPPGTYCASAKHVPQGLQTVREAVFANGLLYVADRDADCVRKYDLITAEWRGRIAAAGLIDKPIHLAASGNSLFIGNRGNESVVTCDLRSERVAPFIQPRSGGLKNPAGLAFGNDGYLYVASRWTRQILRYRLTDGWPDRAPFIDDLEDEPEFIEPANPD